MDQTRDQGAFEEVIKLRQKLDQAKLPLGMRDKVEDMVARIERAAKYGGFSEEFERTSHYIDWVTNLPWDAYTKDRIDIQEARAILDKHHYGVEDVKQRILEFLAVLKLNYDQKNEAQFVKAPILCLVGLAGTGKTTFAIALAEAMDRKFARIPFGGMGSSQDLRGESRLHLEAEPGYVIKALKEAGSRNPVMLLDEIDRVATKARADVMGVLLELLDPNQNKQYKDHYLDYPVDLNPVLFIATANNTDNISTAVVNRLEIIRMPTYSDEEKIIIAKSYVLPEALKDAGLAPNAITIEEEVWPLIVRPLGFDSGIRILKRAIDSLTRKTAFMIVGGQAHQVHITPDNLSQFFDQYV